MSLVSEVCIDSCPERIELWIVVSTGDIRIQHGRNREHHRDFKWDGTHAFLPLVKDWLGEVHSHSGNGGSEA